MGSLIYSAIASLDGYVADERGRFDWAMPADDVHAFANELERGIGTHLYGRRMYEVMSVWDWLELDDEPDVIRDFALSWRAADTVVYSSTLDTVNTRRTRLERSLDPSAVERLKADTERDLSISGPTLAAHALAAGLVDELHLFVVPAIVGGGLRWLPDDLRLPLELLEERRFSDGTVHLRYATTRASA